MGKSLQEILHLFENVKQVPKGFKMSCPLPQHPDRDPSLVISEVDDGVNKKLLVKCFASCPTQPILDYINGKGLPNDTRILPVGVLKKLAGEPEKEKPQKKIVSVYNYRNENGDSKYQIVRFDPKEFKVRRFATKEEKEDYGITWVWEKPQVVIPYNLNLISELRYRNPDDYILKVEGEADCDTVTKNFEMVATCNPFGANKSKWYDLLLQQDPNWKEDLQGDFGKWPDSFSEHFKDLKIVLIPDHDKPGYVHVFEVFFKLAPHVKSIKILELPGPKNNHDDFTDWFNRNTSVTGAELKNLFEAAEELKDKTLEEVVKLFPVPEIDTKENNQDIQEITQLEIELGAVEKNSSESESEIKNDFKDEFLDIMRQAEEMLDKEGPNVGLCKICFGTKYVYRVIDEKMAIVTNFHEDIHVMEKCTCDAEKNLDPRFNF